MLAMLAVIGLTTLYVRSRGHVPAVDWKWPERAAAFPRPVVVALAYSFGLLLLVSGPFRHGPSILPGVLTILALLVLALFFRSWAREFLFLMALEDGDFPGRFDKPIWALTLLAVPPVGLLLFKSYREVRWPEPAAKPEPARDLR